MQDLRIPKIPTPKTRLWYIIKRARMQRNARRSEGGPNLAPVKEFKNCETENADVAHR